MRFVTWDIKKAKLNHEVWNIIRGYNADIILLQEVLSIPIDIQSSYQCEIRKAISKNGNKQIFGTVVLAKGQIISELPLSSDLEWVNKEIELFSGNMVANTVKVDGRDPINVISVYSPAWPVSKNRLRGIDVTPIKLQHNKELWCTEILWSALKHSLWKKPLLEKQE